MNNLNIMDAETLLASPLKPATFIVENLLPQGTHIFCGPSKTGKSWLMLWLCLQVARGNDFLSYKTNKCDVLYLCLEDTFPRIQSRLYNLTEDAPENLRFAVICDKIGFGLEEQLEEHIKQFPETKLVVIDTLQKVRRVLSGGSTYATDYEELSKIKNLADQHNLCIVLVHHSRKQGDQKDPLNQVSGSTGITGSVDSIFVLTRDSRNSDVATLIGTGRDIEYQELTLQFIKGIWLLQERLNRTQARQRKIPNFIFKLICYMEQELAFSGTATELLVVMGDDSMRANQATAQISKYYHEILAPVGITYSTSRTNKCRTLTLHFRDDHDDGDDENVN